MKYGICAAFALLLLVAPLSTQVTTDTLGINVTHVVNVAGDTTFVSVNVFISKEPGAVCDSTCMAEAARRAEESVGRILQTKGGGTSKLTYATNAALTLGVFLVAYYLKGIRDKQVVAGPAGYPSQENPVGPLSSRCAGTESGSVQ